MSLPHAEHQYPSCGACGGDTDRDGDDYYCDDCGLTFVGNDLTPEFRDPDDSVCGVPCGNTWHRPGALWKGTTFDCGTCELPKGHASPFHWTDCKTRPTTSGDADV